MEKHENKGVKMKMTENEKFSCSEKKVLITGASRGIGAALARLLAQKGCELWLVCSKTIEKLEELSRELEQEYGCHCRAEVCDVSKPEQVEALFQKIGDIDILINNAAVSYVGLLTDMSVTEWNQVIGTNLDSLFYTCKGAVPGMVRKKSGKIINVSSVWGSVGASMEVAYSTSKGGVNSFTKALAKELAPSNIQVNAVSFGMIDTEMNACFSEEEKQAITEEIPADRMGTATEAAEVICQVLHAPSYLTGQIITMDGGWI